MSLLIDRYDAALFDLDGVIYLGSEAVVGAPEGMAALRKLGVKVAFVTNNAARPPQTVVDHLVSLEIEAHLTDVVTSAQAGARMLKERLEPGSTVFVVGTEALADEIRAVGLKVVYEIDPTPDAVIQGYDPEMTQPRLDLGGLAIQNGATWFVTNTDSTRPLPEGLVGGAGAQIDAMANVTDQIPEAAGKPCPPLMHETVRRLETERPIFVGDRIDTDIMGAVGVGMDSLFVFTGVHGVRDLVEAGPEGRPTHVGYDIRALVEPTRMAELEKNRCVCREQVATVQDGKIEVTVPRDVEEQLDALWAVLQLSWQDPSLDASVVTRFDKLH